MSWISTLIAAAIVMAAPTWLSAEQGERELEAVLERRFNQEVDRLTAAIAERAPRSRRAYALGPLVGGGFAHTVQGGNTILQLSGGAAVARYDRPLVATPTRIALRVRERALALLTQRMSALRSPSPADFERILAAVIDEVERELMAELARQRLEPPDRAALEVAHLPGTDIWEIRGTAGVGVFHPSPGVGVTFSSGLVVQLADGPALLLPAELSFVAPLRGGPSALDLFGRIDVALTRRSEQFDRFVVGVRLFLDAL